MMAPGLANGDNDAYLKSMDRRLTVLETRFDVLLPLLATKADLAELKAELSADIASIKFDVTRWVVATLITLLIAFGGLTFTLLERMDSLSERIDRLAVAQQVRDK